MRICAHANGEVECVKEKERERLGGFLSHNRQREKVGGGCVSVCQRVNVLWLSWSLCARERDSHTCSTVEQQRVFERLRGAQV